MAESETSSTGDPSNPPSSFGAFDGEELALPAKLQQLVGELFASPSSLHALSLQDYAECFEDKRKEGGEERGRRLKVRMLGYLGQSSSLHRLNVSDMKVKKPSEVEELCRGLRFNNVLESLDVSYNLGIGSPSGCRHIGRMLQTNCTLKALYMQSTSMKPQGMKIISKALQANKDSALELLHLCGNWKLGDKGAEHMAQMLQTNSSLKKLDIRGIGLRADGVAHIARALQANPKSALDSLFIDDTFGDEGAKYIADILSTGSLKFLSMTGTGVHAAGARFIAEGLDQNSMLEELYLGWEDYLDAEGLQILLKPLMHEVSDVSMAEPLLIPVNSSVHGAAASISASASMASHGSLTLQSTGSTSSHGSNPSIHGGSSHLPGNHTLKWLHFTGRRESSLVAPERTGYGEVLANMLRCNTSLTMLGLNYSCFSTAEWQAILKALEDNTTMEILSLCDCETFSGEEVFASLMELLRVNTTIKKIDLRNTPFEREGKVPAVEEQLRRNAAEYVTVLKEMAQVKPKSARLFLCGFPYAGKTTLRKSMLRSLRVLEQTSCIKGLVYNTQEFISRQSGLQGCISGNSPTQRTRGLEIHLLKDDVDMRISIWDLAGQEEFHALHDYMFPDTTNACVFLFVFNCVDPDTGRRKTLTQLEEEFGYWLCFIASNTRRPANVQPLVRVVLSNLDKVGGLKADLVAWATEVVEYMRSRFDKIVDISPDIHAVNARSFESVHSLVESTLDSFGDLLMHKLPLVPEACDQMRLVLAKWTAANPAQPMMKFRDFHNLSQRSLQSLKSMGRRTPKPVRETIESRRRAVASYLHNVGDIIYFENLDFIVVNPHWFGHQVLGHLINFGTFQDMPSDINGFTSSKNLHRVLQRSLSTDSGKKLVGISTDDLVKLMLNLELCYEKEPGNPEAGFFVPTSLDDQGKRALNGRRKLTWPMEDSIRALTSTHIGRRLECGDAFRTFLTPGFFPRFQVILYNEFMRMGMSQDYTLERNLISICIDGMEILVECSGDIGYYVDVLVRSSKTHLETMDFVRQHIVEKIRTFCASQKGCQGVALVEGILRPDCVKNLTLCVHRKDQAVRIEKLKEEWRSSGKMEYIHTWPRAPDGDLPSSCDSVIALLGAREVKNYLDRQYNDIEEVAEKLRTPIGLPDDADERAWKVKFMDQKFPKDFCYSPKDTVNSPATEVLLSRIDDLEERLTKALSRLENSMEDLKNGILTALRPQIDKIHMLQEETLRELISKMDRFMDFSTELHHRRVPRLVYFTTNDVSRTQKLLALVRPGQVVPVRLHLMCEHRGGAPHGIPNQQGCELTWEDDKAKKLRPLLVNGLKLLYLLVKVGAHVAAGIGNAIPDFSAAEFALPLTAGALGLESLMEGGIPEFDQIAPSRSRDAGLWLEEFLRRKNIRELFNLYKVRYTKGQPQLAWVCKEHRDRGVQDHTMFDLVS